MTFFVDTLMNTLLKCGANDVQLEAAEQALRPLQVDTNCNRSVQGTLNRIKGDIEHLLWYDQANIADLSGYRLVLGWQIQAAKRNYRA